MKSGRKQHGAHRLFAAPASISDGGFDIEEFEESDVWGCAVEPRRVAELPKLRSKAGDGKRGDRPGGGGRAAPSSLPVNIPDWSKILGSHYAGGNSGSNRGWWEEGEEEEGEERGSGGAPGPVIPPHELACRSQASPFSVHEGVGRTLKGRELSRVRNAIWEKIGFQD